VHFLPALVVCAALLLTVGVSAQDEMTDELTPSIWLTSNPAGSENDLLLNLSLTFDEVLLGVSPGYLASYESVAFESNGTAWVTVDLTIGEDGVITEGGLMRIPGLNGMDDIGEAVLITGENAGIIAPKGVHVVEELGLILIADQGAKNIKAFAMNAEADAAPELVIEVGEGRSVWDMWLDRTNDILYASGTDGRALAYDEFTLNFGADGPTRIIEPTDADGNFIGVNLHGVDIDYDNNALVLTDVGSPADPADGQVFVIYAASISDGPTPVDVRISGADTMLGNPVDVIFYDGGILIAEKAQDAVLFYADIFDLSGEIEAAADIVYSLVKAESVDVFPPRVVMQ
jgi:hypothetical protein